MTYVRVTRDQRGYETVFLLHTPRPGERPRVLYWYRTAPAIRVGRSPFDEDAIRAIEEQHPDIDFDWPQLIEEATSVPPEVERRPERPRRKRPKETAPTQPSADVAPAADAAPDKGADQPPAEPPVAAHVAAPMSAPATREPAAPRAAANPLLEQLVGREIASRLRARYADVATRLDALEPGEARTAWRARADALDPDRWSSPEAILHGIQHADRLFDELKRELPEPADG